MSATQIIELLRRAFAAADESVVCAYLFGSHARGDAREGSDIDVAVLLREAPSRSLDGLRLDLAGLVEERLHRPVDLVVLNHAPADLVHRILRDGVIFLERDRSARVRFEVKARNEYFDLAPVRSRYRAGAREPAA